MKKTVKFIVIFTFYMFGHLNAQTVHFISMFDTNDQNIGSGMKTERMLITNEMQTIAGYLEEFGYDSKFCDFYGVNCGRSSLMQAINGLQVESNDVIIFYYGGHGARAMRDSDRFPQMCLGEPNQSNWVPSSLVKNMLVDKNPRLAIVLTGCCNYPDNGVTIKSIIAQSGGYTNMSNVNKVAFKELFLNSKGVVQLTSSKAGEFSWCNDMGSFFALVLLETLNDVGKGIISPNWDEVCRQIKNRVSSIDIPTREGIVKQNPDFEITISKGGVTPKKDVTTIKRKVNNANYDLSQDLEILLDKSKSIDNRLNLIPNVLSKHFASGAKVITLGRDMNTVVDYEDADVFLRRIAMSPYIRQINVVEQSEGKNTLVRVHEIRTR